MSLLYIQILVLYIPLLCEKYHKIVYTSLSWYNYYEKYQLLIDLIVFLINCCIILRKYHKSGTINI